MNVLELAGEDDRFAAAEAASAASDPAVVAPGLAVAGEIDPDRLAQLAYTHRASRLVGRTRASIDAAARLLGAALDAADAGVPLADGADGAAPCRHNGDGERPSVAVRARDVRSTAGVATDEAERDLGRLLVDRGYAVDLDAPDRELRALFADDVCVLGWFAAAAERGFGDRAPTDRPFFQPGSMDPLLARALVNLALPGPIAGRTLLDPMCGTGGVLLEAALVGARPLGCDAQRKMVRGSRRNLRAEGRVAAGGRRTGETSGADAVDWALFRGDATRLALRDAAVDAVVFDAPYGRQSKVVSAEDGSASGPAEPAARADALASAALAESRRVLSRGGRAVVVADRSLAPAAREAGFAVRDRFERRVHRSLTRHVLVCE